MKQHDIDFDKLGTRIQELLYRYVAVESITNTPGERGVEDFFRSYIEEIPYFTQHPDHWGLYPLEGDGLGRNVCWAMVRGRGDKAVVLVHHYDVVDIEDYKTLKPYAYTPDRLREELFRHKDMLPEDARKDLESGEFLFCRGGCDMKGAGPSSTPCWRPTAVCLILRAMSSSSAFPMRKICPGACAARTSCWPI